MTDSPDKWLRAAIAGRVGELEHIVQLQAHRAIGNTANLERRHLDLMQWVVALYMLVHTCELAAYKGVSEDDQTVITTAVRTCGSWSPTERRCVR